MTPKAGTCVCGCGSTSPTTMAPHQQQWMESPKLKSTKFALGMARLSSQVPLSSGSASQCPDTNRIAMNMVLDDNKTLSYGGHATQRTLATRTVSPITRSPHHPLYPPSSWTMTAMTNGRQISMRVKRSTPCLRVPSWKMFEVTHGNWLPTGETTAKGSPRGVQSREMGPSLGGPGEKSEKPRRKPVAVRDE